MFFIEKYCIFVYGVCHIGEGTHRGQKKMLDPLELELKARATFPGLSPTLINYSMNCHPSIEAFFQSVGVAL